MKRNITQSLIEWKEKIRRKPLIVRGARQVGKTWSLMDFGRKYFEGRIHHVDFEKYHHLKTLFDRDLDARRILSELEIHLNQRITPGSDLLFLDEIQAAPRALTALRYFHEDLPDLHVCAAGSLLEFALRDLSFPVGRANLLSLSPMTFEEYLKATGHSQAAGILTAPPCRQPESVHRLLLEELQKYAIVGGMPECVSVYAETGHLWEACSIQADLAQTFREDFSKYAPYADKNCLRTVFTSVATSVGRQIKYTRMAEGFSHTTNKRAFDLLCLARVARKVKAADPSGLPLGAGASDKKFKALFVDIGLMQHLCDLPPDRILSRKDLLAVYNGALAEQFVGQELLASGRENLYYWAREARNSQAEVDYLVARQDKIYPVEVKSGGAGRLKSLHMALAAYPHCPRGYVLSSRNYAELPEQKLVFLPLYYASWLGRDA